MPHRVFIRYKDDDGKNTGLLVHSLVVIWRVMGQRKMGTVERCADRLEKKFTKLFRRAYH